MDTYKIFSDMATRAMEFSELCNRMANDNKPDQPIKVCKARIVRQNIPHVFSMDGTREEFRYMCNRDGYDIVGDITETQVYK